MFPLHQIAHVGVTKRMSLQLFGRDIIFEIFQSVWKSYLIVTDRQTDRQTTYCSITALCTSASRGKNTGVSWVAAFMIACRRRSWNGCMPCIAYAGANEAWLWYSSLVSTCSKATRNGKVRQWPTNAAWLSQSSQVKYRPSFNWIVMTGDRTIQKRYQ